uniref:Uncharacterized protein n=1 Tax=Pararge aegeria TaxID=116150 RepID=S4PW12_9NEOP
MCDIHHLPGLRHLYPTRVESYQIIVLTINETIQTSTYSLVLLFDLTQHSVLGAASDIFKCVRVLTVDKDVLVFIIMRPIIYINSPVL